MRSFHTLILVFSLSLSFLSCSHNIKKVSNHEKPLVIFPSPPDPVRIQFLTGIADSKDIESKRSAFANFILGEEKKEIIERPFSITLSSNKLYVCDIQKGGIEIIDFKNKTFTHFNQQGKGELKKAMSCAVDENNYLYVADGIRREIVVFNEELKYITHFGLKEDFSPNSIAIVGQKIWLVNGATKKINVFDKNSYNLLNTFPNAEVGDASYLYQPTYIHVTKEKVYVTDFGGFGVMIFDHNGNFLNKVGAYGNFYGQFTRPKGLTVDEDQNLYVLDVAFETAQIFNDNGQLLMFFGGAYKGPGYMYMPIDIAVDYKNLDFFKQYVDSSYNLKYLIFVANQYGPEKIGVYGFVEEK